MGLNLTIGGVGYNIIDGSLSFPQSMNDRNTLNFSIDVYDIIFDAGTVVQLVDNGELIFDGFIFDYNRVNPTLINGRYRYTVECVDNNNIADRTYCTEIFANKTALQIATSLVALMAGNGVTLGNVPSTLTITKLVSGYKKVSDVLDTLKDVTGLNWNIDNNKVLTLFFREDYFGGYMNDADIMDIEESCSKKDYRNKQIVVAGYDTTSTQSETPTPKTDAQSKQFFVRYPIALKPTILQSGITVSASSVGINGLDTGKWWYWNKGEKGVVQDDSQTALLSTQTIQVTYQGLVKIIVTSQDSAGIEYMKNITGGTGIYENVEYQPNIDSRAAANEFASGLLQKYGSIEKKLKIRSRTKYDVGSIVAINSTKLNINDNFLLESADLDYVNMSEWWYSYTFLSGESRGSWVEFFRKLRLKGENYEITGDEVLVDSIVQNERLQTYFLTNITVTDGLYCSESTYCDETTYCDGSISQYDTLQD